MSYARIYPWRRTRRSRAPSNGPDAFFVAQFSAGYTINMFGFDLRQGQARVLLNNQATDRLGDDLLKLAWPFGLGSCPKVDHDADDADRVPEGAQRIWSRAHGASIPNDPRPTFQILVMRNVSRRGYRGAPGVK